ncbi:Uncharacterised protein [Yersinia enterocolitica]|nr:hypothetical protein [Yersinia enterocolitica]CNG99774.1 Uncharacterised protein [Yersinia enterocolitica]CQH49363.1 Uncharacterised protein [Yersinia enterocolitica]
MRDKYTFKQVDDERTSVTAICIFHLNCGHYQLKPIRKFMLPPIMTAFQGEFLVFLSYLNRLLFKN